VVISIDDITHYLPEPVDQKAELRDIISSISSYRLSRHLMGGAAMQITHGTESPVSARIVELPMAQITDFHLLSSLYRFIDGMMTFLFAGWKNNNKFM
jgi:hypothetical protein